MNTILYFSPEGAVYETSAYSNADIVGLVHDYGLESLTSDDRQFDFWFTPYNSALPAENQSQRDRNAAGNNTIHRKNSAASLRRSCGRHARFRRRS